MKKIESTWEFATCRTWTRGTLYNHEPRSTINTLMITFLSPTSLNSSIPTGVRGRIQQFLGSYRNSSQDLVYRSIKRFKMTLLVQTNHFFPCVSNDFRVTLAAAILIWPFVYQSSNLWLPLSKFQHIFLYLPGNQNRVADHINTHHFSFFFSSLLSR